MLERDGQVFCSSRRVRHQLTGGVITFHGLRETLGHTVTGRTPAWSMASGQCPSQSGACRRPYSPKRCWSATRSRTIFAVSRQTDFALPLASRRARCHPLWPAVIAAKLTVSRSQHSDANVTRGGSPLSHRNSKPSRWSPARRPSAGRRRRRVRMKWLIWSD